MAPGNYRAELLGHHFYERSEDSGGKLAGTVEEFETTDPSSPVSWRGRKALHRTVLPSALHSRSAEALYVTGTQLPRRCRLTHRRKHLAGAERSTHDGISASPVSHDDKSLKEERTQATERVLSYIVNRCTEKDVTSSAFESPIQDRNDRHGLRAEGNVADTGPRSKRRLRESVFLPCSVLPEQRCRE